MHGRGAGPRRRADVRLVPGVGEGRGRRVHDHQRRRGRQRDRLGEHDDRVDADQAAERASDVVADAAEHRDDEVDAAMRAQVLEHGGQPVVGVGVDGGEPVDHVVTRVATRAEDGAGAGDHLDASLQAHQPRDDRRRGFHRDLERRVVVTVGMYVEHDRSTRAPARFVLADHEVAGARGRAPVHPPQVVADLVVAQCEELVAEVTHQRPRGDRFTVAAHPTAHRDRRDDVVDARAHEHLAGLHFSEGSASHAERVRCSHDEGSNLVATAASRRDAIRSSRRRAGCEGWHQEARRAAPLVEPVGGGQQRGGALIAIRDGEIDASVGTDVQALRSDAAGHGQVERMSEREPERATRDECDGGHGEHEQLDGAEQEAADGESAGRADERPAATRQRHAPDHAQRVMSGAS